MYRSITFAVSNISVTRLGPAFVLENNLVPLESVGARWPTANIVDC